MGHLRRADNGSAAGVQPAAPRVLGRSQAALGGGVCGDLHRCRALAAPVQGQPAVVLADLRTRSVAALAQWSLLECCQCRRLAPPRSSAWCQKKYQLLTSITGTFTYEGLFPSTHIISMYWQMDIAD